MAPYAANVQAVSRLAAAASGQVLTSWVEVCDHRRLEHLMAIILTTPVRCVLGPAKQDNRLQTQRARQAGVAADARGERRVTSRKVSRARGKAWLTVCCCDFSDTYQVRLVTRAVKDVNAAYRPKGGDDLSKHGCVSERRKPLHDDPGAGFRRNEPRLRKSL